MKRTLFLTLIILSSFVANGQKTITEDIWSTQLGYVQMSATYSINDQKEKTLERIRFYAGDNRYTSILSFITLFSGSPKDALEWFKKAIDFIEDEEENTTMQVERQQFSVAKIMGQKLLVISEWDGGDGYRRISQSKLESGLEKLEEWITKNKIDVYKDLSSKKAETETNNEKKPENKVQISVADELTKLKKLMDEGVITKEEFEAQKKKLLGL